MRITHDLLRNIDRPWYLQEKHPPIGIIDHSVDILFCFEGICDGSTQEPD